MLGGEDMRSGKQKVGPAKRKTHPLELKLQVLQQLKAGVAVVSFNLEGIHPHDATTWLDQRGICVRAGKSLRPAVDAPPRCRRHGARERARLHEPPGNRRSRLRRVGYRSPVNRLNRLNKV